MFRVYLTRYIRNKSIKILPLHYPQLMEKFQEHEEKKYLMVNDYMLDKIVEKTKETIAIVKFDDTEILNDADDTLPDYITLKNVATLIICITKDDKKLYPQIFLEDTLYNE